MEGAKDPDEYVIKYGNGRFGNLVQNAISLIEFKVKVLRKKYDLDNVNDKISFLKEIAKLMKTIDSKIEQEIYIDKIVKEYTISKEALYAEVNKSAGNKVGSKLLDKNVKVITKQIKQELPKTLIQREDAIISMLIKGDKDIYRQIKDRISPEDIKLEINRKIVETLYKEYEKTEESVENVIELFYADEQAVNKITQIMSEDEENTVDKKIVDNIINVYEKEKLTMMKSEIIQKLNNSQDSSETKELERELNEIIIKLAKYK